MNRCLILALISLLSTYTLAQNTSPSNTAPATTSSQQTTVTTTTTTTPTTTLTIADQNKQAGDAFLATNKTQQGVITLPSGLQYKIITKGNGLKPTKDDVVTVNYEGKHLNGQVFDSSYQRGQPTSFPVNAVIQGWQEALQLMNVGDTWEIFIPANLAYGERGVPGAIGPNETLIFKVDLLNVKKAGS